MARVRVLKRKDGVIQTQHRSDELYDDATLPEGTVAGDVVAQVLVEPAELAGVEDTQAQLDVVDGTLVKDLARKSLPTEIAERRQATAALLGELEADPGVPAAVKRYLLALRDHLSAGPSRLADSSTRERSSPPGERRP
jgi:hypothetical protein